MDWWWLYDLNSEADGRLLPMTGRDDQTSARNKKKNETNS